MWLQVDLWPRLQRIHPILPASLPYMVHLHILRLTISEWLSVLTGIVRYHQYLLLLIEQFQFHLLLTAFI